RVLARSQAFNVVASIASRGRRGGLPARRFRGHDRPRNHGARRVSDLAVQTGGHLSKNRRRENQQCTNGNTNTLEQIRTKSHVSLITCIKKMGTAFHCFSPSRPP